MAGGGHHLAHAASKRGPRLLHEIGIGLALGIFGASFWKVYHLNLRRKTEDFYDALENDTATTIAKQ
eukprot:SM000004S15059  [mRNA]  locus=s4:1005644:1005966:+ [translate_table: standard]